MIRATRACPVDHGTESRSQILMLQRRRRRARRSRACRSGSRPPGSGAACQLCAPTALRRRQPLKPGGQQQAACLLAGGLADDCPDAGSRQVGADRLAVLRVVGQAARARCGDGRSRAADGQLAYGRDVGQAVVPLPGAGDACQWPVARACELREPWRSGRPGPGPAPLGRPRCRIRPRGRPVLIVRPRP